MEYKFAHEAVPEFDIQVTANDDLCVVSCSGTLEVQDSQQVVQPELLRLHELLTENGAPQVRLEMDQVDYINSSGIKAFLSWFLAAERSSTPYRIELTYDPERTWQLVAFKVMTRIAPNTITLSARGT